MASVDEKILRDAVRRAIQFERYKKGLTRRGEIELKALELEIVSLIKAARFAGLSTADAPSLIKKIEAAIRAFAKRIGGEFKAEFSELAIDEAEFARQLIAPATKRKLASKPPSEAQVSSFRILGETIDQAFERFGSAYASAMTANVGAAISENQSQRDLLGSLGSKRGEFAKRRVALGRELRTLSQGVQSASRANFYAGFSSIVIALEWVSTLDNRTSLICYSRDGRWRPVSPNHPIPLKLPANRLLKSVAPEFSAPPAHPHCRSVLVPVTKASERIKELAGAGERASFGSDGPRPISADIDAAQFLEGEKDEFLFGTSLGKSRTKLLRAGLSLGQMVDRYGQVITLDDLKRHHPSIWRKAGL